MNPEKQSISPKAVPDTAEPVRQPAGEARDIPAQAIFARSDYASYDDSTLAKMIQNGDAVAMQVQAVRYLTENRSPENVERANKLLEKAIVHGAKYYPFRFLAEQQSFDLLAALTGSRDMSDKEKRTALVDTFTYYQLAEMRGTSDLKDSMLQLYSEHFQISPTDAEWDQIQSKAGKLYDEYEQRRMDAGLGAFDR